MKKNIQQQVEETINSFDGMQRAEAPAFFHTRVQAKLANSLQEHQSWLIVRRPAWVIASLGIFLVINLFLITQPSKQTASSSGKESPSLQSFANEYDMNTTSNY